LKSLERNCLDDWSEVQEPAFSVGLIGDKKTHSNRGPVAEFGHHTAVSKIIYFLKFSV
jgi:hypothetical protein